MSKTYKLIFIAKYEFYILYLVLVKISAQQQDRTIESCNIIARKIILIILMRAKHIIGDFDFRGGFRGAKTFLPSKYYLNTVIIGRVCTTYITWQTQTVTQEKSGAQLQAIQISS
jgi:hypothetical protein